MIKFKGKALVFHLRQSWGRVRVSRSRRLNSYHTRVRSSRHLWIAWRSSPVRIVTRMGRRVRNRMWSWMRRLVIRWPSRLLRGWSMMRGSMMLLLIRSIPTASIGLVASSSRTTAIRICTRTTKTGATTRIRAIHALWVISSISRGVIVPSPLHLTTTVISIRMLAIRLASCISAPTCY